MAAATKTSGTDEATTALSPEEKAERRTAFRKQHNTSGGVRCEYTDIFTSAKHMRTFESFKKSFPATSANEWVLEPTRYQDRENRMKIGEITLYTIQFTVPDTTFDRMTFVKDVDNLVRGTGFIPFAIDMAHGWDTPESVVVGFHRPIKPYVPEPTTQTAQMP